MTKDEALKMALETLEIWKGYMPALWDKTDEHTITAIKEALEQPEPWEKFCDSNCVWTDHHPDCKLAQRPSRSDIKPLTDEEITDAVRDADLDWHYGWTLDDEEPNRFTKFARAIEAAHGIKGQP